MSAYPDDSLCDICGEDEAEIYADGDWLCVACEEEAEEDKLNPLFGGLELASIYWGCEAKLVIGGKYEPLK